MERRSCLERIAQGCSRAYPLPHLRLDREEKLLFNEGDLYAEEHA